MNRAATEDDRSLVWPVVSKVLRGSPAPNALDQQVRDILDDWVRRDAPRLDADNDGNYDEPGRRSWTTALAPLVEAVMRPVFGNLLDDLDDVRSLGSPAGESYVDKDLRTLLGRKVRGKFHLRYCGNGDAQGLPGVALGVPRRVRQGSGRPPGPGPHQVADQGAERTTFIPGLIPNTMRATNRPTFQQVLEFQQLMTCSGARPITDRAALLGMARAGRGQRRLSQASHRSPRPSALSTSSSVIAAMRLSRLVSVFRCTGRAAAVRARSKSWAIRASSVRVSSGSPDSLP